MRGLKMWTAAAAMAVVSGCANGGNLTSPSPLAVAAPTVPSTCALPGAPADLTADVSGSTVTLSWSQVGDAADYVVLVGRTPATSDTVLTNTAGTSHAIGPVAAGTHFARIHAHNWCGTGDSSEVISFRIG